MSTGAGGADGEGGDLAAEIRPCEADELAHERECDRGVVEIVAAHAAAVQSDGRGATTFIGANDTPQGRALNRRIEVQFWYDDPLQELPEEPQMCPAEDDNEIVTRVHQPSGGPLPALTLEGSEIIIPAGLTDRLRAAMDEVRDRDNVRLRCDNFAEVLGGAGHLLHASRLVHSG